MDINKKEECKTNQKFSGKKLSRSQSPVRRAALAAFCILALAAPSLAQEQSAPVQVEPASTRIEVDDQAGVIRFFIDGREKARFDAAGLHVRENIDYGGMLTDYGQTGFDERAGWKEYERLKAEGRDAP